jgi:hypothetical protein
MRGLTIRLMDANGHEQHVTRGAELCGSARRVKVLVFARIAVVAA